MAETDMVTQLTRLTSSWRKRAGQIVWNPLFAGDTALAGEMKAFADQVDAITGAIDYALPEPLPEPLSLDVAAAINTAHAIYVFGVAGTRDTRASVHAALIWAMTGRRIPRDDILAAITAEDSAENALAQAARDAMMPYACFDCGTEVDAPGQEPDHFTWCPRHHG